MNSTPEQSALIFREFSRSRNPPGPSSRRRRAPGRYVPVVLDRPVAQIRVDRRHRVLRQLCGQGGVPDEVGREIRAIESVALGITRTEVLVGEDEDGGHEEQQQDECTGVGRSTPGGDGVSATRADVRVRPRRRVYTRRDAKSYADTIAQARANVTADGICSASTAQNATHVEPVPSSAPATHAAGCLPNNARPRGQPGTVART